MNKMIIDYSFIKAILEENNPNNTLSEQIYEELDFFTLYIPEHIFIKAMNLCQKENTQTKEKVYFTLTNSHRIQRIKPEMYNNSLETFTENKTLSYSDCLTIECMKEKEIKHILSFNEKFDTIKGINRIYEFNKDNPDVLNYIKYENKE